MEEKKVTFKSDGSYQRGELKDMEVRKGSHEKKGESVDMTLGNKIQAATSKGNGSPKQGYDLNSLKKKGKPNANPVAEKSVQTPAPMAKTSVTAKAVEDVVKTAQPAGLDVSKLAKPAPTLAPVEKPIPVSAPVDIKPAPVEHTKEEVKPVPVSAPVEEPKEEVKEEPVKVEIPEPEPVKLETPEPESVKTEPIEVKKMNLGAGSLEKTAAPAVAAAPIVASAPKDKTFTVVSLAELLGDQPNWDASISATRVFISACLKSYVGKPTAVFESASVLGLRMYTQVPKTAYTRLLVLGRGEKLSVAELSNANNSIQDASYLIKLDSAVAIVEDTVVLYSASTKTATQTF